MSIGTQIHSRIAEVVIDHPPVNALDSAGWNELARVIAAAGGNTETRGLRIRAAGKGFCAGVDLKEIAGEHERIVELNKGNYLTFKAIRSCEVPVVTAVHGFVI